MKSGLLSKLAFWSSSKTTGNVGVFIADDSLWVCNVQKGTSTHTVTHIPVVKQNWNQAFEQL